MIKNLPLKIRLIAPSSNAATIEKKLFNDAISFLQTKGFIIAYSNLIFDKENCIETRLIDLYDAFKCNSEIIMPVRGGFESNELLDYINFELIDFAEKFFFGFSDTSVLLNAMSLKIPKSRFIHGPNLITFAQIGRRDITFDRFVMALNSQYDISPINFYANYTDDGNSKLIEKSGVVSLQEGIAEGEIWGGNLSSIQLLLGTSYMPQKERDIILFIEEDELCGDYAPQMFKRALHHLSQQKISPQIKGIIFGQFEAGSNITPNCIKSCLKDTVIFSRIPAATNFMFGHTIPTGCFPVGGYCYLDINQTTSCLTIKDKK